MAIDNNRQDLPQQYILDYNSIIARIDSEINHTTVLVETRLEALRNLINQRLDFVTTTSKRDLDVITDKIQDALQELRIYKDTFQQQLILLDGSIKSAHQRLDALQIEVDDIVGKLEIYKRLSTSNEAAVEKVKVDVQAILAQHSTEALLTKTKKESPFRVFMVEHVFKKYAALTVGSLISFLALNIKNIVDFLISLTTNVKP